ncbi:Ribosome biogenesis [Mycena indigotica]|uniref:Ribosome biogenesis n=1 Tax=Mycena indigotica TaxID=2126181 RepID=A0A8H6SA64_9AGAR|nr:Ribosome biogenesis [Mycena indigotica]KAF7295163.1 Ribosome biogenesis [Mycena indigotica]
MSSTLGKRKERDPDGHGSTLFVSNLPYTATSTDLQTLFSDIAPVRSAFVVTESGTGVSKGVGYVSFTLKEDAESAFETISTNGISLVGRSLRVQWADSKATTFSVPKERGPRPKVDHKPTKFTTPIDPLAIRTIIVSGVPSGVDSKTLWKKFRKCPGAVKVDWPVTVDDKDDPTLAHVLFSSPSDALSAVGKLHAHVFKGSLLSVTLKKRQDALSKPLGKKLKTAGAPSHASRLIVRNIPFDATEQDLRAIFLPYGPLYSIHIPLADETTESSPPRTKGYGFVWMLSRKDAERAMEACNGITLSAGVAEDLVSDKQKKKKQRRVEMKSKKLAAEEMEEDDEQETGQNKRARVIAVDWALSKDRWQEAQEKQVADQDMETESESDSDSDSEDSHVGVHDGSDSDQDDSENENQEIGKPQLPLPEEGTTLFVRNVPFIATDDELRILFRAFGPLRYARVTMDPETGRSRGTGFACFWNKQDADKVIEQSDLLRLEATGSEQPPKNPFAMPSLLTADPSSTLAQSLVLHGRTLDVVRAVTRDVATKLKEEGERKREKADKRDMYLLREGVILANTPAAEALSAADLERRTTSFNTRKALLKSNPALFISRTRLSVRQIPLFVTERGLKRLAIHAVRAFQDDVKNGTRLELSTDELAEPDSDGEEPKKLSKKQLFGRRTGVKQAKIVRQSERVDPVTGKAKSKGYGFVEMNKHADALRLLRWANNNPNVMSLFETWWKEELQDLIKAEKAKGENEQDDTRLKKMQSELEIESRKTKGTLILEFSIENITTIQRRDRKEKTQQAVTQESDQVAIEERPTKKRRVSKDGPEKKQTEHNPVGSLIGRKRRERKLGKVKGK